MTRPVNRPRRSWVPVAIGVAVAAALAAVFAAYLNPHMALDIANRVWACF